MKAVAFLAGATAIATTLSFPAFAQSEFATGSNISGVSEVNDRLDDIQDSVSDDFDRSNDYDRFGPSGRQGMSGGLSLTYKGSTGNDETQDFALAGRVSSNQGPFAQSVGIGIEYGTDDNGDTDEEDVYAIYDGQYYFNDRFYAFVLGRIAEDGTVNDDLEDLADGTISAEDLEDLRGKKKRDAFLGFGPGYRVISTQDTAWRVQAGVGIRYTQTADTYRIDNNLPDKLVSNTETGYILSSRFYHRFNDSIFITNDTDYLTSDEGGDEVTNDFGVNFKVTDQLATRFSWGIEYEEDREIRTDNTVGVSLVYGF